MKKIALLLFMLLCLSLVACVHNVTPPPPPNQDFTVTATWQYNFSNFPGCSSTVTTSCISGFTWGYLNGSTQVPLKTSLPSACTGSTQPESCTDNTQSLLPMGSVTFYLVVNTMNSSGQAGSLPPVNSNPVTTAASNALNFSVTAQ